MTRAIILWGSCLHWQDPLLKFSSICAGHHKMTWIASSGLHDLCKVIRVFIKGSKNSWDSPLSAKASGLSLGSSASSIGLLQEFNKVVISMTSRPCWHQWQFHQQSPPLSLMTTTHAPPMSMLSFCLHLSLCLLSPFGINGKGCPHTCLWNLWSLLTTPPVNMHDPRTCLYAWSTHPFSFEFILQSHELKVC